MAYGSGSIFRRGRYWYYQAWVNGEQVGPFSSKSTNRADAQRLLKKLNGEAADGTVRGATKDELTVRECLLEYFDYLDDNRADALHTRGRIERHMMGHYMVGLKASELDTKDMRHYRAQRKAAPATVNHEIATLRAAMRMAQKQGRIRHLPYFPMKHVDNARKGFTDEPDFLRFLDTVDVWLRPFAACAYYSGMRRAELVRLDLADMDLDAGFLEIRKTKNKEPRMVPIMDGPMRQWLQWAWDHRLAGQKKLFVWSDGKPFTLYNFYDKWNDARKAAGMDGFILHDCRRSCNRNLRNIGVPRSVRKKIIGHKSDSMDERYGIVDIEDARTVAQLWRDRKTTATPLQPAPGNPPAAAKLTR